MALQEVGSSLSSRGSLDPSSKEVWLSVCVCVCLSELSLFPCGLVQDWLYLQQSLFNLFGATAHCYIGNHTYYLNELSFLWPNKENIAT